LTHSCLKIEITKIITIVFTEEKLINVKAIKRSGDAVNAIILRKNKN